MIVSASLTLLAWIATYAVHSVLWLVPGIWFARRASVAARSRATVLLICVIAPFMTTAFAQFSQSGAALPLPGLRIEENREVKSFVDAAGKVESTESGGLTLASRIALLSISGLAAAFALVAVVRAASMMRAHRQAVRNFGKRTPVISAAWVSAFDRVVRDLELNDPPRFTCAEGLSSPVALRGEVCIPVAWIDRNDANEMRVVLAHEIEHVVWRDPQVLAALQFMRRALPWQPLLSLASVSYLEAVEEACDSAAIRCTGDATSVARVLLRLAPVQPAAVAFTSLNSGRGIRQRIERIVAMPSTMPRSPLVGAALIIALTVLSAALPHVVTPERSEVPDVDVRVQVVGTRRP